MRTFLEWFKSSAKVKRWMFLIIVGIALVCYGFTKVLVTEEMAFGELGKIIAIFVVGFVFVVVGIIFIQKRNLEILIEANDTDSIKGKKAKVNIKSLIFNKKVYDEGPKIVVIGGGEGLNIVVDGLKKYTNNITAIVTMSDYGQIPTESRMTLDALPLDDIKGSMIAMSEKQELMRDLMNLNFANERLRGLNFGDIYLTAMNELYNNISEAIQKSTEVLNINGRVLPVTLDEINICAELTDGTVIERKDKIPEIVSQKVEVINRIFIHPSNCKPAPGVVEAIQEAEAIIIGPGSLYTNVLPNLLVKRVSKAIKESKAVKIYISNIMTEFGQTDNYSLAQHIEAMQAHVGKGVFDYCLVDTGEVVPEYVRRYNKKGSELVETDITKAATLGVKIIQKDMSCIKEDKIRHNSAIIASTVVGLICDELKFKDEQNGTEFLLLNSILKEEKKEIKKNQKEDKKHKGIVKKATKSVKSKKPSKKSKFSEKYKERVESIQNTDAKIKENRAIAKEIEKLEKENEKKQTKKKEETELKPVKTTRKPRVTKEVEETNKETKTVRKPRTTKKKEEIEEKKPTARRTKKKE